METKNKYDLTEKERQKHVDAILSSSARKKIVVAGPGTGKTYLFQHILENKGKSLALTFINSLVEDLSLELYGISEVRTLHSFARSILSKDGENVKVFPKLSEVIKEDAKILLNRDVDFGSSFHNKDIGNKDMDFYEKRRSYYDNHYGYSDIVFSVVRFLESNESNIPTYGQIVVDEFQDFNKLEVSLIELLSKKSPVLIVGDDDQALYDFKNASADYIRERHSDNNVDYVSFTLPYCSRCTRVIIDVANDIITAAKNNGYLSARIDKPYKYFDDKDKDRESSLNQKIIHKSLFAGQIPWFINDQIQKIAGEIKGKFSILIISPTKIQSRAIVEGLRKRGFKNIESTSKKDKKEVTLLDGLKILLEDNKSNLGWRIVSKILLEDKDFKSLLKETEKDSTKSISKIVNVDCKKEIKNLLKIFREIKNDKDVNNNDLDALLKKIKINPYENAKNMLNNEILSSKTRFAHPGLRKIPIKATTIQSSKGLDADYVFITHFDDQFFIKDRDKRKISNQDICNFLVALTRAKRKVFLIPTNMKKEPTFLKWINSSRIERI